MVKNLLWPLVVIAGLSLSNPSKAALGWTWDECQQHWGKALFSERLPDGQLKANFAAHDLLITVWLTEDKVSRVAYQDPIRQFSTTEIVTFQKANAIRPTADWVFAGKDESTQNYTWELRENPNKTDSIASAIFVAKENTFFVFTEADNQRAKDETTQEASGL